MSSGREGGRGIRVWGGRVNRGWGEELEGRGVMVQGRGGGGGNSSGGKGG